MKLNLKNSLLVTIWVIGISFAVGLSGCQKNDAVTAATPQTPIDNRDLPGPVALQNLVGLYKVVRVNQCTTWARANCDARMVRLWGTVERGLHLEQSTINNARNAVDLDQVALVAGGISAVARTQENWGQRHEIEVITLVQDGGGGFVLRREVMNHGQQSVVELLLQKIR
jgi:hypothetical protein